MWIKPLSALSASWRSLFLLLLVLGIFFRFYHLGHKAYWGDEVFTSLRISGHSAAEATAELYTGDIVSVAELQQYQHPAPTLGWSETVAALQTSPEHTPLYYGLAHLWARMLGGSADNPLRTVWAIRSLSALASLLALPAMYWLCRELFDSALTGWVGMGVLAVSPFQVLYAQEARPYSLWTVTILVTSAALLRAMRRQTWQSWGLYALTLALGLYTFLFSGLVAIAHGLYILLGSRLRWTRAVMAYLLATLAGLLLFSPWIGVIAANWNRLRENVGHLEQTPNNLVQLWLLNLSRIFFDFNHGPSWLNPLTFGTLALAGYALYFLCRHTPPRIWLFVICLIGVTGVALVGADLLLGGQRSAIARYPIPCYLGIQVAVAYLLSEKLVRGRSRHWQRGAVALLMVGVLSIAISSQSVMWWNKGPFKTRRNPEVAAVVNGGDRPLVISDHTIERVLSLSYLLEPEVQVQLVERGEVPPGVDREGEVFLYQPSQGLRNRLERRGGVRLEALIKGWLWRVER